MIFSNFVWVNSQGFSQIFFFFSKHHCQLRLEDFSIFKMMTSHHLPLCSTISWKIYPILKIYLNFSWIFLKSTLVKHSTNSLESDSLYLSETFFYQLLMILKASKLYKHSTILIKLLLNYLKYFESICWWLFLIF